jgi:hypothetical protein
MSALDTAGRPFHHAREYFADEHLFSYMRNEKGGAW